MAFLFTAWSVAAGPDYFTNVISRFNPVDWGTEDGLPDNAVTSVGQTGDGYLWLTTKEGLSRFDGVKFSDDAELKISTELGGAAVSSVHQGRHGVCWLITEGGELFRLDKGKVTKLSLPAVFDKCSLTKVFEDGNGVLWIGSDTKGLLRAEAGTFGHYSTTNGLAHNSVRSICEDKNGKIWIATGGGVNCLDREKIETFTVQTGLLHNATRAVCADREGNLWVASHFGLTRLRNGQTRHFTRQDGLSDNLISAIYEDRSGVLWVGTFNGLNRLEDGVLVTERRADGSSYDRVNVIFEDDENNLWIATRDGLTRLTPRVLTAYTQQHGLTHHNASSIMEDRAGNLWVGFWGGGVNRISRGKVQSFTSREGLASDFVLTMYQRRSGDMWFGLDYDAGLNVFQDKTILHYGRANGLKDDAVKAICDDQRGTVWIGTRTALYSSTDGQIRRYGTEDGFAGGAVEAIKEDASGTVWFGTSRGLAKFADRQFTFFTTTNGLPNNSVTGIYFDAENVLWVTTRGGLARFHKESFISFTHEDGLYRDELFTVLEDGCGFLWMSCRDGIFRVNKGEIEAYKRGVTPPIACRAFGKMDGMVSVECKGSGATAACKGSDGRLWFPTSKGIVAVDPRAVTTNVQPPRVVLQEIRANGSILDPSLPIELSTEQQQLSFRFTAFDFSAPEKLRFKYRLGGLDKDWIDAGNGREARYVHVPAGEYRFEVVAANRDGFWNAEGASTRISFHRPFWQTWWFGALIVIVATGLTAVVVRYVSVKKLQRKLALLEQQHAIEKERSRIAKDMHDDLGANLTQICILSELAKRESAQQQRVEIHADAISDTARELVQSMDEIVWAANPKNDTLKRLSGYIFQYAEKFLTPADIRGRFDHPVSLPDLSVSAEVRHNLFLAVKEGLNNVVKHSGAKEVKLRLAVNGSRVEITMEDNGKGFAITEGRPFGNGLCNMQKRIEEVGGEFAIESVVGRGTRICVRIALEK